ncbi:MAG: hypothetical protein AB8F34_16720 [Akkermansiaceae bacterium]
MGVILGLVVPALADPPKKPSVALFSKLINASPFTIKPPPPERAPAATPLERDWMLGSIRPHQDGYAVTLINKKDRKDRIRFIPGYDTGEFKLLNVRQDPNKSSNSRVQVSKGSVTAWLTYDEKLIKVRPSVAATKTTSTKKSSSRSSSQRGGPPVPGKSNSGRSSRQRTVPRK